ncbi:sigma 54-interacting transcriptional regulator [Treponema sp.]
MIKILVVVPYEELYDNVHSYIMSLDTREFVVELGHLVGSGSNVVKGCDADIVVARGITGRAIARENPKIHTVEIAISAGDLISALWKCRASYGADGVGVVVVDPAICNPDQLMDLTGIPLQIRKAEDEDEVYAAIDELAMQGIRTFVGGLTLCRRCEKLGYEAVHIKTGEDTMRRAVNEALASARALNRERARTNLIATVLNSATDAMFALNREGVVIAANAQAAALFLQEGANARKGDSLEGTVLEGRSIFDLQADGSWELTVAAQPEIEVLRTFGTQLMLVKTAPIMVEAENIGVLVTCRNVEALQETEQKIRKELNKKGLVAHYCFQDIVCENLGMKRLIEVARKYALLDSNLFILGETGTGKELFAQSIHNEGKRRTKPFVAVNCAALPEPLLESELFGYTEGAFSGAVKGGRIGLFELAHTGTIFLDEIGDLPLLLQAKLLRVLQEKEIRKVGGDTVVPVDVRVISATNIDILEKVRSGQFRRDLYYRINLLTLKLLPLRQRPEDIEAIFRHFVQKFSMEIGRQVPLIDPSVLPMIRSYPWMGNIRELCNFCERLVLLNESGRIEKDEVESFYLFEDWGLTQDPLMDSLTSPKIRSTGAHSLARQLSESGLDRDSFAQSLGISRTTLWRKLKEEQAKDSYLEHESVSDI